MPDEKIKKENEIKDKIIQGEALFLEGRIQECKDYFLDLMTQHPSDPDILNNLGVINHTQGENDIAEKYFLKAIKIDANHIDAKINLLELMQNQERDEKSTPDNNTGKDNFDYKLFWNDRYKDGGDSGLGSYGVLADFKAEVINEFIKNNFIESTIEFGCGDGNQVSLIDYSFYTGLDVSEAAIALCIKKFEHDANKNFFVFNPADYKRLEPCESDLVVCLDVLYHILDENDFVNTLDAIFKSSKKFIILYTMLNEPSNQVAGHIKYRDIRTYTDKYTHFEVFNIIDQKHPDLSSAAFIIFKKKDDNQLLIQGENLFASGKISEAEKCFNKLLSENPYHIQALNNIGVIAFQKSNFRQALDYFKRALEADEYYIEAVENYSKSLIAVGDYLGAFNFMQKSFNRGILNTELLNLMGNCFIEFKDLKSAKTIFEKSLSLNIDQEEIVAQISEIENILKDNGPTDRLVVSNEKMNIGFVSIWFERGQSYVTKTLRDCLSTQHNTFVFARTGGVYGEPKLEKSGAWDVPNLTTYPEYQIPPETIKKWISDNSLHAVVFNEEYDWELVRGAKESGAKVLTYLDYYKDDWKRNIGIYDAVICSTQRTYNLVKNVCKAYYMGWGVDTDLFRPQEQEPEFTFFHNAGWLGINFRKMTPAAIAAFDAISRVMPHVSMFIHSQARLDLLPPIIADIVRNNRRIVFHEETMPAPGLYHKGKIMLFPTKLEGLGLPLFEALSCGLPVITTNAPPMNEFITEGYNGSLVNVSFRSRRDDNVAFPEEIVDMTDLANRMARMANDKNMHCALSKNARQYAEQKLALPFLKDRVLNIFKKV